MRKPLILMLAIITLITPLCASAKPHDLTVSRSIAGSLDKMPDLAKERTNEIIIGIPDLIGQTNPLYAATIGDTYASELLFDELVFIDEYGEPGDGIAKMKVSQDNLTYTFELRAARYSDEALVTPDDFINTLYFMLMPGYDGRRDLSPLEILGASEYQAGTADTVSGIVKLSDTSFSVTLVRPNPSAPSILSIPALRIAHFGTFIRPEGMGQFEGASLDYYAQRIEETKNLPAYLAGYGQYDVLDLTPGAVVHFAANLDYWRAPPSNELLTLLVVPEDERFDAIMNGIVDIIHLVPNFAQIDAAYDNNEGFISIYSFLSDMFGYIGFGGDAFNDERVRAAFAYALDRKQIVTDTIMQYGVAASTLSFDVFEQENNLLGEKYPYDVEKANALLDEAGWVVDESGMRELDGKPFEITFAIAEENPFADTFERYLANVESFLSIKVTLVRKPFEELYEHYNEYDMYVATVKLPQSPAISANLFSGGSHLNTTHYSSDGLTRFLEWAALESTAERQSIVYEGLYQQIYLELPVIPLYRRYELLFVNARIRNFYVSSGHDIVAEAYRMIISTNLSEQ